MAREMKITPSERPNEHWHFVLSECDHWWLEMQSPLTPHFLQAYCGKCDRQVGVSYIALAKCTSSAPDNITVHPSKEAAEHLFGKKRP